MNRNQQFPINSFTDRLMSSTWPVPDTILMSAPLLRVTDDQNKRKLDIEQNFNDTRDV